MNKLLRSAVLAVGMLMVMASLAAAAGVNLAWNDCPAGGGVANATFACNTNTGNTKLFGSYDPPAGITALTGQEIVLDLLTENAGVFSDWWRFKNAGTCRQSSLSVTFAAPTSGCADYWAGQASGAIAAYNIGFNATTNRARLILVAAVDQTIAGPVDPGTEYYSFGLQISNTKTVGTGSCAGCAEKVCIVLNSINCTQPLGVGDFAISAPLTSNIATWQSELSATCLPVPTRNRTWGAVKSLYR